MRPVAPGTRPWTSRGRCVRRTRPCTARSTRCPTRTSTPARRPWRARTWRRASRSTTLARSVPSRSTSCLASSARMTGTRSSTRAWRNGCAPWRPSSTMSMGRNAASPTGCFRGASSPRREHFRHAAAGIRPTRRRAHPCQRHRHRARPARHLARARGQRARALGRQLRALEPARHVADVLRALRHDGHPARARVLAATTQGSHAGRARGQRRPHDRAAHAGRLQPGLLRALPAGSHDGRGARRGP